MSWPTLWIGLIACAVFPPLIPVLAAVLLWQATDGGERIGIAFEVWAQRRAGGRPTLGRRHTPAIFGRCPACGEETVNRCHIIPNDKCWDPPVPATRKEAAHG